MRLEKARWYNDAQCAVVLTIDDLAYGYMDTSGSGFQPFNDWGYGCRGPNSIFRYFESWVLERHPEIKYTVFLPFGIPTYGSVETAYPKHAGDIFENPEFGALLRYIVQRGNEIAYHGHAHGRKAATIDPRSWIDEDRDYTPAQYREMVERDLERARSELGITVRGGRTPGYSNNASVLAVATSGLFRWWSFDYTPLRCPLGYRQGVFAFPTNLSGGVYHRRPGHWRDLIRVFRVERGLRRLVAQQGVITVTEHFLRTRPDGRRQTPNVYDDVFSLNCIFTHLKQYDVWYATCSEIAHYQDSYDHTELRALSDGVYELSYRGGWDRPRLTLAADCPRLRHLDSGAVICGARRRGRWHYNDVMVGRYQLC